MSAEVIFNPKCSKCRSLIEILETKEIPAKIIDYVNNPLTHEDILELVKHGISIKKIIRTGEPEWSETGLDIEAASDDDLINAIIEHPILLQRPIVVANGKAVIARPPEKVLEIL